jgi:hypothetical protein
MQKKDSDTQNTSSDETTPSGKMTVNILGSRGHLAAHEGLEIAFHGKTLKLVVRARLQVGRFDFGSLTSG